MVMDDGWIMSLLNGFGGLLNMNMCISMRLNQGVKPEMPLIEWVVFYNTTRPHSSFNGQTPDEVYNAERTVDMIDKLPPPFP